MTRSSNGLKLDFDPKIERTLFARRRGHSISEKVTIHTKQMPNIKYRTLKELTISVLLTYLSIIIYRLS